MEDLGVPIKNGAGNGTRTRDLHLGKVALYHLSYSRSDESKLKVLLALCQGLETLRQFEEPLVFRIHPLLDLLDLGLGQVPEPALAF